MAKQHSTLARPGAGQTANLLIEPDARLEFAFNQGEADFSKEGQNLVLTFEDGATLVLEGFYNNFGDNAQPPTLVVQGNELPGEAFLAALNNPDLMPAAGPAAAAITVGGGQYADAQLDGVQGVDSMGKLDFEAWAASGAGAELSIALGNVALGNVALGNVALSPDATPSGEASPGTLPPVAPPVTPTPPVEPPVALNFVARGVIHLGQDVNAPPALVVDLQRAHDNWGSIKNVTFYDDKGNVISPFDYTYDNGQITFTNPLMQEAIYRCVIEDERGNRCTMQLVVTKGSTFDSSTYGVPPGDGPFYGEWHAGHEYAKQYDIVSSDQNDSMSITADSAGGAIGMWASSIDMGAGDDNISINVRAVDGNAYGVYSYSSIDMGAGNDTITISAISENRSAVSVNLATIDMGTGDDLLMLANGKLTNATLFGGANNVVQQADEDGGVAHLGDILGLGGDLVPSINGDDSIFTFGNNKISGFESLLVDLEDGNPGGVSLDVLLEGVEAMNAMEYYVRTDEKDEKGNFVGYYMTNDVKSLIIKGDATDYLDWGNNASNPLHSGVTIDGVVDSSGANVIFNHYILDGLDIYIQQQITMTTG